MKIRSYCVRLLLFVLFTACFSAPLLGRADAAEWSRILRPVKLVSENNGIYKLSNIRWGFEEPVINEWRPEKLNPKWRTVEVDANSVKDVIFVVRPFPPEWLTAHCLMFIEFNKPVRTENGETTNTLTLSVEARLLEGQNYDLLKGNFGEFYIVYLLMSKEDYLQECSLYGKRLIPYKLKLSHEQKVSLVKYIISESIKNRDNEKYNTLTNSCTNNLFILLNSVLAKEQQFKTWILKHFLYNLSISMPRTANIFLARHGLVEEKLPMICPKIENCDNISSKSLSGDALEAAKAGALKICAKADSIRSTIDNALDEGVISKEHFISLMYNDVVEQALYLIVPGTVPEEMNNGEFINGREFGDALSKAAFSQDVRKIFDAAVDSYKAAVMKRMCLEGPDISKYLNGQLDVMNKTFQQHIKYSQLNSGN